MTRNGENILGGTRTDGYQSGSAGSAWKRVPLSRALPRKESVSRKRNRGIRTPFGFLGRFQSYHAEKKGYFTKLVKMEARYHWFCFPISGEVKNRLGALPKSLTYEKRACFTSDNSGSALKNEQSPKTREKPLKSLCEMVEALRTLLGASKRFQRFHFRTSVGIVRRAFYVHFL